MSGGRHPVPKTEVLREVVKVLGDTPMPGPGTPLEADAFVPRITKVRLKGVCRFGILRQDRGRIVSVRRMAPGLDRRRPVRGG